MKVGDLVKVKHDEHNMLGHGVVLEIDIRRARVHWVDEWEDCPVDWNPIWTLEVINEGRGSNIVQARGLFG